MRAKNMQALTNDVTRRWPGVTIYGIGDAAHKDRSSDHNEDDTPGSKTPQTDKDSNPEHRAIDIMVRGPFTKSDADALVASLLADPAARSRMLNIIWNGYIWSRSWGWTKRKYDGSDQHKDHIHISGLAADDENASSWPAVGKGVDMTEMFPRYGEEHDGVGYLQYQLENLGFDVGNVDNDYGDKTAAALSKFVAAYNGGKVDGKRVTPAIKIYLDVSMTRKFGKPGPAGKDGRDGKDGKDGLQGPPGKTPTKVLIEGVVVDAQ